MDQLIDPLVEGLLLHHVLGRDPNKEFRRKLRQLFKLNVFLTSVNGIPNLEVPGVVKANNITGNGLFHVFPGVSHEFSHVRQPEWLLRPFQGNVHPAVKFT